MGNQGVQCPLLHEHTYHIARTIAYKGYFKKLAVVFLDKSVECIAEFLGTAYSGNFVQHLTLRYLI